MNKTPFTLKINYPHEYKDIILDFYKKFPDMYLGGSYALNALGLINRDIYDLDFCISIKYKDEVIKYFIDKQKEVREKEKKGLGSVFFDIIEKVRVSEPIVPKLQKSGFDDEVHIHEYLDWVKCGVFFYKEREKTFEIWDPIIDKIIEVSSPNRIIEAKKRYINAKKENSKDKDIVYYGNTEKHLKDLKVIKENLKSFNNKIFFSDLI